MQIETNVVIHHTPTHPLPLISTGWLVTPSSTQVDVCIIIYVLDCFDVAIPHDAFYKVIASKMVHLICANSNVLYDLYNDFT